MSNLIEAPQWEAGIYQLEESDPVMGGPEGIDNRQAKQLANRTGYLKAQVEAHAVADDPHPQYAPEANPALIGTPTAPTAAADTSTAQIATTAFVINQAATAVPVMDGVAAVGVSKRYARHDHVHPTDSSRAPLASPALTGTPTAPTPAPGTNNLQLANTAFVAAAVAALVSSSPAALDTLKELADAIGDDPNFATTMTNALAAKAPLASPALTGTPTAPTPVPGSSDASLATTAYVQKSVNGMLTKSVAGGANINLSAGEVDNGILVFTGALTANIAVIVPAATGMWSVLNRTTGAYSLTVKTQNGTGIVVTQGKQQELACDGTNVFQATNDFDSAAFTGAPTAPTPGQFDNSTKLATMAAVQRAIGSRSAVYSTNTAPLNLTSALLGQVINYFASAGATVNLPSTNGLPSGVAYEIQESNGCTIAANGTDTIIPYPGGTASGTLVVPAGMVVDLTYAGAGQWLADMHGTGETIGSLATNGYLKIPVMIGGVKRTLVFQWGQVAGVNNTTATNVVFPLAFPNQALCVVATQTSNGGAASRVVETVIRANSYFDAWGNSSGNGIYWIAIGW